MQAQSKFLSWSLLFLCNLMWALQFTCIKLVQGQVGPLFTVWFPTLLSLLILLPIVIHERRAHPDSMPRPGRGNIVRLYLMLGLIGVVPGQLLMTWGTRISLATNAALLTLLLPLTTALAAVLFLHEKMTPLRWLSFAVALVGVVLCSSSDIRAASFSRGQLFGNALVFLAILGSSFYNSYGKRALEWHSPMEMLFWTYVVLTAMMTPFVLLLERNSFVAIPQFTHQTWLGLTLLTLFHTCLSMILFLKALKSLDAIQAALSNYLIAFFGIPIAAFWLHERIGKGAILGGLLVVSSTLLITLLDKTPAKEVGPDGSHSESQSVSAQDCRT